MEHSLLNACKSTCGHRTPCIPAYTAYAEGSIGVTDAHTLQHTYHTETRPWMSFNQDLCSVRYASLYCFEAVPENCVL